jgi:ankyrin repeat protein
MTQKTKYGLYVFGVLILINLDLALFAMAVDDMREDSMRCWYGSSGDDVSDYNTDVVRKVRRDVSLRTAIESDDGSESSSDGGITVDEFVGDDLNQALLQVVTDNNVRLRVINNLLGRGADASFVGFDGDSVFIKACCSNNIPAVQALLEHGVDINKEDKDGNTALILAAQKNDIPMVRFLLDCTSKVVIKDECPICLEVFSDKDLNEHAVYMCKNKHTAHYICAFRWFDPKKNSKCPVCREWMFNPDPESKKVGHTDVNKVDRAGDTPLIRALAKRHMDVVQLLLGRQDINVNKALVWAIKNERTEIAEYLFGEHGVDINRIDEYGNTSLIWACKKGHKKLVTFLVARDGIDLNKTDEEGETPLIWAAKKGHDDIVACLVGGAGIDINKTNKYASTAVMWAARNGHTRIVQILLGQHDIQINTKNNQGNTALINACEQGRTEIVRLLLDIKDIDVNEINNDQETALMCAEKGNHQNIVTMLRAHGAHVPQVRKNRKCVVL